MNIKPDHPRDLLTRAFRAAVDRAQPDRAVSAHLPAPPPGRTIVIGAGKGAAPMAWQVERQWSHSLAGAVITPYGYAGDRIPKKVQVLEAAHPIPDAAGVAATLKVLEAVEHLAEDDLVLDLISGGGSALLTAPMGISLEQKAALTDALLKSGATIHEINTVRKHLSAVKGGRLAQAAHPARIVSLIVSDVVGDDLSIIASGPTVPDPGTYADALAVLDRYGIDQPEARRQLKRGAQGEMPESPKPGDPIFQRVDNRLIVTGAQALEAAAEQFSADGIDAQVTSANVEGESRTVAREQAAAVQDLATGQAMISGGETTVTVRGSGRGGPNLEFLLALAVALQGAPDMYALAADTDGKDGTGDAAGAIITPDTLSRAAKQGLDPAAHLEDNDAHSFFQALGDLLVTGPTGTNVNDIRIVIRL
ncbi:MAG: glycerate kinase [Fidelibacterota bacterium]|nr:MAG: glycerate kinase [Candidatus Neomarinimicrobiota bacterium]